MDWGEILLLGFLGLGGLGLVWFIWHCCMASNRCDIEIARAVREQVACDVSYDIGRLEQEQREA